MLRHPERKCVITNAKQAALDKPSNSLPVNAEEFKGGKTLGCSELEKNAAQSWKSFFPLGAAHEGLPNHVAA